MSQKIGIVIPCYNEGQRLPQRRLIQALQDHPELQFCLVNDGSSDDTAAVTSLLAKQYARISALQLNKNVGKAEAVRAGVQYFLLNKEVDYIGYWDADLATPLFEIKTFMDIFLNHREVLGVLGSRVLRLSGRIKRKMYRHLLGRIFATFVSLSLHMEVYDSQCGAKIFKTDLAARIFLEPFTSRWFFDVELLFRCKALPEFSSNPLMLYESPLSYWEDVSGSKLRFWDFFKVPFELFKIHRRYSKTMKIIK